MAFATAKMRHPLSFLVGQIIGQDFYIADKIIPGKS